MPKMALPYNESWPEIENFVFDFALHFMIVVTIRFATYY